ncbi:MAG: DUF4139 domain-containing protein [Phycisphaerae bacterium]|nr:DUF4139 domain-containing protein [Phycisphaerae bacterium]
MKHLIEQQLIEYLYELDEQDSRIATAEHLENCPQCRAALEELKAKFAQLDVLKDDVGLTESLIFDTLRVLEKARNDMKSTEKSTFLPKIVISVAALFMFFVGIYIVINQGDDGIATDNEVATNIPGPAKDEVENDVKVAEKGKVTEPELFAQAFDGSHSSLGVKSIARVQGSVEVVPVAKVEELLAKKPFAPASNIELNVLPRRKYVQLTIYNDADLTLVRETRDITFKAGWNWLQFMWANTKIDPTSLEFQPLAHADKIEVQQLTFSPRLKDLGRWLMSSEVSGQVPVEITYLTSGLSWRAFYTATLNEDETKMDLSSYVRVENQSGETYDNAQTRLVVGQVNLRENIVDLASRQYAYGLPEGAMIMSDDEKRLFKELTEYNRHKIQAEIKSDDYSIDKLGIVEYDGYDTVVEGFMWNMQPKKILKQALSEYQLYTIEGTETLSDSWSKRLPSFAATDIEVESLYKYDEDLYGAQAVRFVKFANDAEHELGLTPLPQGNIRVFGRIDDDGHLNYIGGVDTKYIPVNEEVELNLGPATQVMIEPKLVGYKTDNYRFDGNGNINGFDEVKTFEIEINNTRAIAVDIEINRNFNSLNWDIEFEQTDVEYEKHDATHGRFKLEMKPASKRMLRYELTVYNGVRRDEVLGERETDRE